MIDAEVLELLGKAGSGSMASLAYDTAWVARLTEVDQELSNRALDWISANQLSDGSWGADKPFYYHDRVISTLAAMIALNRGRRRSDRTQIERGQVALERITGGATSGLQSDPNGATVGFEMIAPTLAAEAQELGIISDQGQRILGRLGGFRQRKLLLLQGRRINRNITAAFSAEMTGGDGLDNLDIPNLKETDGSVGHSPSATAYYLLSIDPTDRPALDYLHRVAREDGGFPNLVPFDVFEIAWSLWNLSLVETWDAKVMKKIRWHLEYLWACWKTGLGVGLSRTYSIPDGDDTAIVYQLLTRGGFLADIDSVLSFEENDHFRTYHFEADTSNSVASHVMGALRQAGRQPDDPGVRKALEYLLRKKGRQAYWLDKWHLSPFYTTSHAVIACTGYLDEKVSPSVDWMLANQQADGSWGQHFPTAEETAYCLQALCIWRRHHGKASIPIDRLRLAAAWLERHSEPPYPPLWIGKGLYCPELVVRSAVLGALRLVQES